MTAETEEEKIALLREVVPRTLRSLFVLRISLGVVAILLALLKINLVPPLSSFYIDVLADGNAAVLHAWVQALNGVVSGLLAAFLALMISTFLIQARVRAEMERYIAELVPEGAGAEAEAAAEAETTAEARA